MLTPEQRKFLKCPLTARMSVIDAKGYPHTVPVWFDVDGEDIVIISDRNTRKVPYIDANPKGNVCIGGDGDANKGDATGYMLKGEFVNEPDPDYYWLRRMTLRYESGEQAEKDIELWRTTLDMMIIRLKVRKITKV